MADTDKLPKVPAFTLPATRRTVLQNIVVAWSATDEFLGHPFDEDKTWAQAAHNGFERLFEELGVVFLHILGSFTTVFSAKNHVFVMDYVDALEKPGWPWMEERSFHADLIQARAPALRTNCPSPPASACRRDHRALPRQAVRNTLHLITFEDLGYVDPEVRKAMDENTVQLYRKWHSTMHILHDSLEALWAECVELNDLATFEPGTAKKKRDALLRSLTVEATPKHLLLDHTVLDADPAIERPTHSVGTLPVSPRKMAMARMMADILSEAWESDDE